MDINYEFTPDWENSHNKKQKQKGSSFLPWLECHGYREAIEMHNLTG